MDKKEKTNKAHIVAVSMGYGHQRTAYPLRNLAPEGKIIFANDYEGMPKTDRIIWQNSQNFYEFISKFQQFPFIGNFAFHLFDRLQKILKFYPKRDLSTPNITLKNIFRFIHKGWGRHFIESLVNPATAEPLPFITTYFVPAFMAESFNYQGEIYCVICDADISRTWAPLNPQTSRIKYFAPNERVTERLKLYGIKSENIFLTGYPLPEENIGSEKMETLKSDLEHRIINLDPKKIYRDRHSALIKEYLGNIPHAKTHPLTLMFSIGGAGAQKDIAVKALKSLAPKIKNAEMKFIISVGVKSATRDYFLSEINKLGLEMNLGKNVEILYEEGISNYFKKFNETLRLTDILWTKPSELSFYSALGIPIIIAPPLGSQENFNRGWLRAKGAGIPQDDPAYADEWLFDFLNEGRLAEAAMEGFIDEEKLGASKIERIISRS
ncbi:MAG: hypothetical protein AAB432_01775 [Patescibacteria group bacterium]